jgi:hypothetical protein
MSRRFGRNQKRKLLALCEYVQCELDLAKEELAKRNKSLNASYQEIMNLNGAIKHFREVLGNYFVALPVQDVIVQEIRESMTYANFKPSELRPVDFSAPVNLSKLTYAVCLLETSKFDSYRDELSGHIHIRYKTSFGASAYAIHPRDAHMIYDQDFQQVIAREFSEHLLKKKY